jgi:hypothetical protein
MSLVFVLCLKAQSALPDSHIAISTRTQRAVTLTKVRITMSTIVFMSRRF